MKKIYIYTYREDLNRHIPQKINERSQILRNPLKFALLTIFGCKTPNLGSDVMVLYLQRNPF